MRARWCLHALVRPADDGKAGVGLDAALPHRPQHLQPGENAKHAVKAAACGRGMFSGCGKHKDWGVSAHVPAGCVSRWLPIAMGGSLRFSPGSTANMLPIWSMMTSQPIVLASSQSQSRTSRSSSVSASRIMAPGQSGTAPHLAVSMMSRHSLSPLILAIVAALDFRVSSLVLSDCSECEAPGRKRNMCVHSRPYCRKQDICMTAPQAFYPLVGGSLMLHHTWGLSS